MVYESKIDVRARKKALERIKERFGLIIKDILSGRPPVLGIRKRTLSNTIYDPERKLLLLGDEVLHRSFLNAGEAKKFMQTVLMASIIYEALKNDEYPTIRDLYYRGKHTIRYRKVTTGRIYEENTWDEQQESDSVIRDIEVFIDMLREDMLILSKEKGKVVGNMRIRSGDDVIDLSKMGHGAYAIEPTPDLIEFIDVDADFVLVIEKDAVFQQLHRAGFWKKYKAILVTSAGQPDRATRRFIRRLNEELKLPVYILTDSIPADEVVIVRDPKSGIVSIGPVETLVGKYFNNDKDKERVFVGIEVPSWNPKTGKIRWYRVGYVYRHKVKDKILRIITDGRGEIRVTKAHSLFVFRNGYIEVIPAKEIRPGDYIVVASRLPLLNSTVNYQVIDVVHLLKNYPRSKYSKRFNLWNVVKVITNEGKLIKLSKMGKDVRYDNGYVVISRSKHLIPAKIKLDEELAWFLGFLTVRGLLNRGRCIILNIKAHEKALIEKVVTIVARKFNIKPKLMNLSKNGNSRLSLVVYSRLLCMLLELLGLGSKREFRSIPEIIVNSPRSVVLSYVKGIVDGEGYIDSHGNITCSIRSKLLSKQLFNLLLSMNISPKYMRIGKSNVIKISKSLLKTPQEVYRFLANFEANLTDNLDIGKISLRRTYGEPTSNDLMDLFIDEGLINYGLDYRLVGINSMERQTERKLKSPVESSLDEGIFIGSDIALVKVIHVSEEDYDGYVYDFAVPITNSFVGSYGVIYHNSDPYGWYIYSVFKVGSINLSYESLRLATPEAKFLGVSMTDVFGHKGLGKKPYLSEAERRNFIIKATERDIKRAKELMNYAWFRTKRWKIELDLFLNKKAKLEIEALTSKGLRFLMDKYLPEKISTGDWID